MMDNQVMVEVKVLEGLMEVQLHPLEEVVVELDDQEQVVEYFQELEDYQDDLGLEVVRHILDLVEEEVQEAQLHP